MKNKKWVKIAVIAVVAFFGLSVIKDVLIKSAVTIGASAVTGAPVKIRKFHLGVLTQSIHIKDFKMYNPKGYPKDVMLDIPEVTVDCNIFALLTGKLHLELVVLDLKELVLYKNKEGVLNVDALKVTQTADEKPAKAKTETEKEKKPAKELAMQIDLLRLNVGKVVMKDYSQGGTEPRVQVYDVGINNKEYKDIKSAQKLVMIVMLEAMGPTAIKSAKMYAASAILGVGFLPAGVAGVLIGEDSGVKEFSADITKVFKVSRDTVARMGEVKNESEAQGLIKGKVDGVDITITLIKKDRRTTEVSVKARKFMIPKPEVAKGVLYEITEKLK